MPRGGGLDIEGSAYGHPPPPPAPLAHVWAGGNLFAFRQTPQDSELRCKYAIIAATTVDGWCHGLFGVSTLEATLAREKTGSWIVQLFGGGGDKAVELDEEQRELLMDKYMPYKVVTKMQTDGVISTISYSS